MQNSLVVKIFRVIAEILEINGENVFRVRAYRRAADVIEGLSEDLEETAKRGALRDIPGIGSDLEGKIKEIVSTGSCAAYAELKKTVPEGLLEIMNIPTVGPKTAKLLYDALKVKSIAELEQAIQTGRLEGLPGIKGKTISNIQKGITLLKKSKERMPLATAIELSRGVIAALAGLKAVGRISEAGSLRRRRETVRDIDILVTSKDPASVMETFTSLPFVADITAKGPTKSSIRTAEGIQVDCRVVDEGSFGAALVYFTGSKDFNIRLRTMAAKKGWKVSEYGVFALTKSRGKEQERLLAGKSEEDIFKLFKIEYIPPELREDAGEIELALKNRLPTLITLTDIKGDLHCHSTWSDGVSTVREMAEKARSLGYAYMAITDHSQSLKIARGLDRRTLRKKKEEIDALNAGYKDFRILFGTEADIDPAGNIDYPDEVLKEFDVVIAAVHTGFKQAKAAITGRLIAACRNKYVHVIAHPTGRLWGEREGYDLDFAALCAACADTNTALEINTFPQRLDLNDQNARLAKTKGVRIAINTDSHAAGHLDNMKLGISVARRGWLEAKDVVNTLTADALLEAIKK
jgi:DNA polymerase (family X)